MADPFEVRMKFSSYLTHLSANQTSLIKTAHFALKHRDFSDDLHSCILEQLEQGSTTTATSTSSGRGGGGGGAANLNNRANIMYFLEHHADTNMKEGGHAQYVEYVRRDIGRIVEAVAQSGANVKVCRKVVGGLGEKGVLDITVVEGIERGLREKEDRMESLLNGEAEAEGDGGIEMPDVLESELEKENGGVKKKLNGDRKVDKRAIEQRIEEDRERNKRLRESVWAVAGNDEEELDKMWDEGSDLNEDDYVIADEEAVERKQFVNYHRAMIDT